MPKKRDWHIDGRDVFIQDWNSREEMTIEEAERRLNAFDGLERHLGYIKKSLRTLFGFAGKEEKK
jgi:hypothetical protein